MKLLAIALFATFLNASAANAAGGAEPMPGTNYTDMPPYHGIWPYPACCSKHARRHARWHWGPIHEN